MPRVKVSIPDPLLQVAADAAHAAGRKIDDLYEEALVKFIEANKHTRPGALRNRGRMPVSSPKLTIEIPEELFQEAEKVAKRLGKKRDALYAMALEGHVKSNADTASALDQGHDLPTGAWRPNRPA